jgi:hypothetical protein
VALFTDDTRIESVTVSEAFFDFSGFDTETSGRVQVPGTDFTLETLVGSRRVGLAVVDGVLFTDVVGHPVLVGLTLETEVLLLVEGLASVSGVGDAETLRHVVRLVTSQTDIPCLYSHFAVVTVFPESTLTCVGVQPEAVDTGLAAITEGRPFLAEETIVDVAEVLVQVVAFGTSETPVLGEVVLFTSDSVRGAGGTQKEVAGLTSHAEVGVGFVEVAVGDSVLDALSELDEVTRVARDAEVSVGVGQRAVLDVLVL